ncbi:MAG: hypothetical protein ACREO9_02275 [Lysobacterales bacterium]
MNDVAMKIESVKIEGVETIPLVVRNIDGEGVLFTRDGRIIGHQVPYMGHYYYQGHGAQRVKMFRATFIVDTMPSDAPRTR